MIFQCHELDNLINLNLNYKSVQVDIRQFLLTMLKSEEKVEEWRLED